MAGASDSAKRWLPTASPDSSPAFSRAMRSKPPLISARSAALAALEARLQARDAAVDDFDVRKDQLVQHRLGVADGVHAARGVRHRGVVEGAGPRPSARRQPGGRSGTVRRCRGFPRKPSGAGGRSTKATSACTIRLEPKTSASASSRGSGTFTTPTLGLALEPGWAALAHEGREYCRLAACGQAHDADLHMEIGVPGRAPSRRRGGSRRRSRCRRRRYSRRRRRWARWAS